MPIARRPRAFNPSVIALVLTALAGCDAAEFADGDLSDRGGFGCTQCYLNSATVNDALITELNLDGAENAGGVRLVDIYDPGTGKHYRPDMDTATDSLRARNNKGAIVLSGEQMLGKVLSLSTANGAVSLRITEVDTAVPSWSTGGAPTVVYRMRYNDSQGVTQPICVNTSDANKDMVTLIYGETYDRETNEIIPSQARWFTIACVAEAAYKMKMMDCHPEGQRHADLEQRRTTLRMITADYCGDGTPYTESGTTVAWRNADGTISPEVPENRLEAKWGPDGAICLDDPRIVAPEDVHCDVPRCDGDASFSGGIEWRTMLP